MISRETTNPLENNFIQNDDVAWEKVVSVAEKVVNIKAGKVVDIKAILGDQFTYLTENVKTVLASGNPVINMIVDYYFKVNGKQIRPLIVLLMSQATSLTLTPGTIREKSLKEVNSPLSDIYHQGNVRSQDDFSSHSIPPANQLFPPNNDGCVILPSQRRLAEIAEILHTSSLFHDDVIDDSDVRRGRESLNAKFGNKKAILAGDFLLGRSIVLLARLRESEVVELMSTVISNLVEGELLQIKEIHSQIVVEESLAPSIFDPYLEKTYLKTASLIANSCKATTLLSGTTKEVSDIAFEYGKNIGIAFQLIDDMLDFVSSTDEFGKPVGADLKLGLTTAPVLFAQEEFPELSVLIKRKFKVEGDVEMAQKLVHKSQGLAKTKALAQQYCSIAIQQIQRLPPSESRDALVLMCTNLMDRKN